VTKQQDSATVTVTPDTLAQLAALSKAFGVASLDATLAAVVDRFHAAHLGTEGKLPEGWRLRDDLTLSDFEAYYDAYDREKPVSTWHRHGRTIRSAIVAGWFAAPEGVTVEDAGKLKPAQAPGLAAAVDELYLRLSTDDPK